MKIYNEMDFVMMKMQMMGNDKFTFGMQRNYDTKEEMYKDLINVFQEKLEELKENPSESSKYGYRAELEIFEKGEPTNRF